MITVSASETSETVIDDLYEHETLYEFYVSFKIKFIGMLTSYLYDDNSRFSHNDLKDTLYHTVGELPSESPFSKFIYTYEDFIAILSRITKLELPKESKIYIEKITKSVFETIAKGIRIAYHDPYFEYMVADWETQFKNSKNDMEQNIDKLHELSMNLLGFKDNTLLSISELIELIQNLKHANKLVMVTFISGKINRELNNGRFDAAFFDTMSDDEFESLLKKFAHSHNAIVHYGGEFGMESTTCRLRQNLS